MFDLYKVGDQERPIIASYPGNVLRIFKSHFNHLCWPLWQLIVIKNRKLIYNPIGKCGSSSLKHIIISMSDISSEMKGMPLDTHSTGLQLGDLPIDEATEILHDRSYLKFAVLRDPFDRLVSAYLEKFVLNRMDENNQFHTSPVISRVLGVPSPTPDDFSRSITFARFVDYIVRSAPDQLDPHWCPQYMYLRNAEYKLYMLEDLDELYNDLQLSPGTPGVDVQHNITRRNAEEVPEAYALTASEMPHSNIATACFYNEDIRRKVRSYFALDFKYRSDHMHL